ncbi:MAG: glycosyltransferase, partial [Actinomycetota bacterium]
MTTRRICFVCNEYPPAPHGGIGVATRQLAHGLLAEGNEVRVVGVYPAQTEPLRMEDDGGVTVFRLSEPRVPFGVGTLARMKVFRLVRRWSANDEI